NRDGSGSHLLTGGYDRDIEQPKWSKDGKRIYFATADRGNGKIGWVAADGSSGSKPEIVASDLGGGDLGRPYEGGSYTVAPGGRTAYSWTRPTQPPEVALAASGTKAAVLTRLNDDLFTGKQLADSEEIWTESSFDHKRIQGWILKPP